MNSNIDLGTKVMVQSAFLPMKEVNQALRYEVHRELKMPKDVIVERIERELMIRYIGEYVGD